MKQYDVQIKVNGVWSWAAVAPSGHTRGAARRLRDHMKLRRAAWEGILGAKIQCFRIAEVTA